MAQSIWLLAEQWQGKISDLTFEGLALGREVADQLGVPLEAVLVGHGVANLVEELGIADSVLYAEDEDSVEPVASRVAAVLAPLVRERAPLAVIIPLSNMSLGVGTHLSAQLQAPAINFCRDLRVRDGRLEAQCVMYGGKIEATVVPHAETVILGLWPGARPAEGGRRTKARSHVSVGGTVVDTPRAKFRRYIEPDASDVDITQKEILIAVGRGIQNEGNLGGAQELAEMLDGAVCGSRPVIDQGWLPLSRQIGKSGLSVKAKAYLAFGISGAPEHVEGMRDSSLIVAVNSDKQAPIFNVAHVGVVADAMDIIDELSKALQERKK